MMNFEFKGCAVSKFGIRNSKFNVKKKIARQPHSATTGRSPYLGAAASPTAVTLFSGPR
jgi:hypothetical protein